MRRKTKKKHFFLRVLAFLFLSGMLFGVFYLFFWMEVPDKPTNFEPTPEQEARLHEIFTHPENYPEDLLEKVREFPEAVDFVYDYPTPPRDLPFSLDWDKGKIPHFLQWDERWGYKKYCGSFFGVTGCGPTALAMVYDGLSHSTKYNPYDLGILAESMGYGDEGMGTDANFMVAGAKHIGLEVYVPERSAWAWRKAIKKGHPLILNVGPGDFTAFGHYLVVADHNGKGFVVLDPNSRVRGQRTWTFDELERQTKSVWAYIPE